MRTTLLLAFAVSALTPACDLFRSSEGDGPHCEDRPTAIALDEVSPLGFTAQALIDVAVSPAPWAETLSWAEDGTTPLTLSLGSPTGARFIDSVAVYPDGEEATPAIAVLCESRVALDVTLRMATDDGGLDETWTTQLASTDGEEAAFFEMPDPYALGGNYDVVAHITEPDYDSVTMFVAGRFAPAGTSGELSAQVTGQEECAASGECAAWAMELPIGSWGSAAEQ